MATRPGTVGIGRPPMPLSRIATFSIPFLHRCADFGPLGVARCLTTFVSALGHDEVSARLDLRWQTARADQRPTSTGKSTRVTIVSTPAPETAPRSATSGRIPWPVSRSSALPCSACLERLADERIRLSVLLAGRSLCELQLDDGVHQPLLRAISGDPALRRRPGLVRRSEADAPRGRRELVAAVGVWRWRLSSSSAN